jgi:hypothetical protein
MREQRVRELWLVHSFTTTIIAFPFNKLKQCRLSISKTESKREGDEEEEWKEKGKGRVLRAENTSLTILLGRDNARILLDS